MGVALSALRTEIRERCDQENSDFISDSELNSYINASYGELYDLLVSKMEEYFITSTTFTVASGASSQALPSGFYKIRGVDRSIGGAYIPVRKFNFAQRGQDTVLRVFDTQNPSVTYRTMGQTIYFEPPSAAPGDYRVWYVPQRTVLSDNADETADGVIDDWREFIVVDACIKCMLKEESDASGFMALKQQQLARIEAVAQNRDVSEPDQVTDIRRVGLGYLGGPA